MPRYYEAREMPVDEVHEMTDASAPVEVGEEESKEWRDGEIVSGVDEF